MDNIIEENIEHYFTCNRCKIDSLGDRMCPCPRGSCEAKISGTVTRIIKLNLILTEEQIKLNLLHYE